ncbi:hypothetical protein L6452_08471 [Arctium lappa]|uniref:Uncharacterized protein n=1 Tax=Arctium lappa TaxID=4217 RepID=A0ACB9DIE2_ARCLA|nr:hypothetical protein L6452_08471 [Arctium lappa]
MRILRDALPRNGHLIAQSMKLLRDALLSWRGLLASLTLSSRVDNPPSPPTRSTGSDLQSSEARSNTRILVHHPSLMTYSDLRRSLHRPTTWHMAQGHHSRGLTVSPLAALHFLHRASIRSL